MPTNTNIINTNHIIVTNTAPLAIAIATDNTNRSTTTTATNTDLVSGPNPTSGLTNITTKTALLTIANANTNRSTTTTTSTNVILSKLPTSSDLLSSDLLDSANPIASSKLPGSALIIPTESIDLISNEPSGTNPTSGSTRNDTNTTLATATNRSSAPSDDTTLVSKRLDF